MPIFIVRNGWNAIGMGWCPCEQKVGVGDTPLTLMTTRTIAVPTKYMLSKQPLSIYSASIWSKSFLFKGHGLWSKIFEDLSPKIHVETSIYDGQLAIQQ